MGLAASLLAMAMPGWRDEIDHARVRQAATGVATRLRLARHLAVASGRSAGLLFALRNGDWTLRTCLDGTGDSVRSADVQALLDPCLDEATSVSALWPGSRVAISPSIPGPDATPPGSDAVRFGAADIASFSPLGSGTPGTLFLQSRAGAQYAVRVAGTTGRIRVLRYHPSLRAWLPA